MKQEKEYLTKDRYEELRKELDELRTVRRKEVAENLEYSKQLGDLSENAEYHQAREEQAILEDRIAKLDGLLKSASVIDIHTTETANVGTTVEIRKEGKSESAKYTIVGSEEADMQKNKLSVSSPLGAALKGKKKGDTVSVSTPGGKVNYKIIDIA